MIAWIDGVTANLVEPGTLVVQGRSGTVSFSQVPPSLLDPFQQLKQPGVSATTLASRVAQVDPPNLAKWFYYVESLIRRGLLEYAVLSSGQRVATLVALSPFFESKSQQVLPDCCYALSPFVLIRRKGNHWVVESPQTPARVTLLDFRLITLLGALETPGTLDELMERASGVNRETLISLMQLLLCAQLIQQSRRQGLETSHPEPASLQGWSFHDLLFHSRTRSGRFDAPQGATYRFSGIVPPPPSLRPLPDGESIPLHRPNLQEIIGKDPPLAWVQDQRRSVRAFDSNQPISIQQLGEFLYRIGRLQENWETEQSTAGGPVKMQFSKRPFPSGGSLYELELYLVVQRASFLEAGFFYYDAEGHRLIRMQSVTPEVMALLTDASRSTEVPAEEIQVLLIIAARYMRLSWKYESIAYSLILKHVGVLMQTMYLVATAMKLGPCAIGGGNSDLFARISGNDYYTETSVGEFLLGTVSQENNRLINQVKGSDSRE